MVSRSWEAELGVRGPSKHTYMLPAKEVLVKAAIYCFAIQLAVYIRDGCIEVKLAFESCMRRC